MFPNSIRVFCMFLCTVCSDCQILIDVPKFHLSVCCMFLCVVTIESWVSSMQALSLKAYLHINYQRRLAPLLSTLTTSIDLHIDNQHQPFCALTFNKSQSINVVVFILALVFSQFVIEAIIALGFQNFYCLVHSSCLMLETRYFLTRIDNISFEFIFEIIFI